MGHEKYSQAGQDEFVLNLFGKDHKGFFVDVGCGLPDEINNTLLLEENGWSGISIDNENYADQWKSRNNAFICEDALNCNYNEIFEQHQMPKVIDYLSLDIEGEGSRYKALERIMQSEYEFKFMTVEHDVYRGYYISEAFHQRSLLTKMEYVILCCDVRNGIYPFEDWWINPKYFKKSDYIDYVCSFLDYNEILNKIKK
jgi:hypothetical protein